MLSEKKELLKKALIEARMKEFEDIPAEDELEKEHEFSKNFEKKIEKVKKLKKRRAVLKKAGSFAAGFIIICALTGAALSILQNNDFLYEGMLSRDSANEIIMDSVDGAMSEELAETDILNGGIADEALDDGDFNDSVFPSDITEDSEYYQKSSTENIVTDIYNEDGRNYIRVDYSMDDELAGGEVNGYIEFRYPDSGTDDAAGNASVQETKASTDISYDVIEEEGCLIFVISSKSVREISEMDIHLDSENKNIILRFSVNPEDGSLKFISQDE